MIHTHLAFTSRMNLCFVLLTSLLLLSCQPQQKEQKETQGPEAASSQSLLRPEQLQQFVPAPLAGFQLTDQRGTIDTSTGVEISNLSLVFRNEANDMIILSLQDYLHHPEFYALASGLWNDDMAFERDGSYARRMELPERQKGWTSFDAEAVQGTMMIGVHDRFLASVRTEQLPDMIAITEWMQSGWLSKLP